MEQLKKETGESHQKIVKILHLRLKIMKLMNSYLLRTLNINPSNQQKQCTKIKGSNYVTQQEYSNQHQRRPDFGSCLRLLNKQQNISILNDATVYLVRFILANYTSPHDLQSQLPANLSLQMLEESLIGFLNKLILSKYQSHVENGLNLVVKLYEFFNPKQKQVQNSITKIYQNIALSPRVHKLLQQDKKQKLWQLAYILANKFQQSKNLILL